MTNPVRILLLYSDTGGGHRSAAGALREALNNTYGAQCHVDWVDVFQHFSPYPFNQLPAWYPFLIGPFQPFWGVAFHALNHRVVPWLLAMIAWPYVHGYMRKVITHHQPEVLVSVHPILTIGFGYLKRTERPPMITVVTDLISTHAFWFNPNVECNLVPTEPAHQLALRFGIKPEQVQTVGLPVDKRFSGPLPDKLTARTQLGWASDVPAVLLMSGGEGIGPIQAIARAIATSGLRCQLAIIAGRNERLRAQLSAQAWEIPTHVYGFVNNIPELMTAADVLITKAGPGTITEALNLGLPMLLCSRINGQEEGNVDYVVQNNAGFWTPQPAQVVAALRTWLNDPAQLQQAAANARRLARPHAAHEIAQIIFQLGQAARTTPTATK